LPVLLGVVGDLDLDGDVLAPEALLEVAGFLELLVGFGQNGVVLVSAGLSERSRAEVQGVVDALLDESAGDVEAEDAVLPVEDLDLRGGGLRVGEHAERRVLTAHTCLRIEAEDVSGAQDDAGDHPVRVREVVVGECPRVAFLDTPVAGVRNLRVRAWDEPDDLRRRYGQAVDGSPTLLVAGRVGLLLSGQTECRYGHEISPLG